MTITPWRVGLACLLFTASLSGCSHTPRSTTPPALPAGLADARFLLLGEVHDNPLHHEWRAAWLRTLLADGRPTLVVFEQMDRARDAEVTQARDETPNDSVAIARAGGLDERGWRWPLHRPLFDAALAGGATLAGGNLARDQLRAVVREGPSAMPADLRALIDKASWTPTQQGDAEADIAEGHCGMLPASQLAPMALAQRVRDAAMTQALLAAPPGHRAVLIAGNGHVRRDSGVSLYLRAAGVPPEAMRAVGFVEGDRAAADGRYDAAIETPTAPRSDPCEALRGNQPVK